MYRALVKEFHLFRTRGLVQRGVLLESNRKVLEALKAKNAQASYEARFRHVNCGKNRMLLALDTLQLSSVDKHCDAVKGSIS